MGEHVAEEISTGELSRRMDRQDTAIAGKVGRDAYESDQRGQGERIGRAESRLRDIETARIADETARQAAEAQMQQWRRQSQLSIALAVLSAVVAVALFIAGAIAP